MKFSKMQLSLEKLVQMAHEAVSHVGAANYPEREQEAHEAVDTAANLFAAELAQLEAENAELREALQPFADAYELQHEYAVDYWDSLPEYHQWEAAAETLAKKA
jgi:hypothetical protein